MYVVIYRYKVPSNMRKRYLELMRKTADLYAKHGCLGYEVLEDAQHKGDWLEINRFRNKEHYEKVYTTVNGDPQIEALARILLHHRSKENPPIKKLVRIKNERLKNEDLETPFNNPSLCSLERFRSVL